jgi:hypothetical protein
MGGILYFSVAAIVGVVFPDTPLKTDVSGRPDIYNLQQAATAKQASSARQRGDAGHSRGLSHSNASKAAGKTSDSSRLRNGEPATIGYSYTQSLVLPPTTAYHDSYSEEQTMRNWRGPKSDASKPTMRPMPSPPTLNYSSNAQGSTISQSIPSGNRNALTTPAIEKPFANYSALGSSGSGLAGFPTARNPTVNRQSTYNTTKKESGNYWTWTNEVHQLIEAPTGRVLQEWESGSEKTLRYNQRGQTNTSSHNYFMNHGSYFSNSK